MPEVYFDTRDGTPLIGAEAAGPRIDEAGPDVVPLAELLTAKEFPYTTQDFEKADVSEWQRDDYINFGKWALSTLRISSDASYLTVEHIQRLHKLGMGPEKSRITHPQRFGSFTAYQKEIGSPLSKGMYDDWSTEDFLHHARNLSDSLDRKPSLPDYDEVASRNKGPSYKIILERIGGIGILHESLGYPDIPTWSDEDFILWGVRVMQANPQSGLHWTMPDLLSSRQRGPSMRIIFDHFPSWKEYKTQVEKEHTLLVEQSASSRYVKLERYDAMLKNGQLPKAFRGLDDEELLQVSARYRVADTCTPEVATDKKLKIAMERSATLIYSLRKANSTLTADDIERTAMELAVFDDIWPMDEYKQYLHIPVEELSIIRREKNKARLERRKKAA